MVSQDVLRDLLKPGNSVLIAWDVHRALFNGIFNKDEFQRALGTVIEAARRVRVPIIFTRITPFPSGFEPVTAKIMQWRGGFRPEEMDLIVQPQPSDIVINKNTWSLFVGTNVELLLRNSGRYTVVFTGIATEIGVETSARHAYALGFVPVIVSNAVSSYDREAHERSLANMRRFFPILTAEELARYWS
ncbi:cysteine hydrolase family protein [Vulcanisaeta souniana]|uniref:Isochorismatase n=1 Tax=Vulcanisaeta souniana JCM 11219 TaxID=1293586 RepID=A0A830E3T0_9CREN|nr:cysteine hydrolase [Vulcanisaeta souniana]BDR92744.1 isochorismatase [Vulcanisaeta souniana JCM 11219]GGI84031.1 isochorismatase [Vulcanisaeta souniana JCM 11219]